MVSDKDLRYEDTSAPLAERVRKYVEDLQALVTARLQEIDGRARFRDDPWSRSGGGGGLSAVMEDGAVFEKAGVNTSTVHGELPARMVELLGEEEGPFFATGISLVIHPRNPYVPAVHANFRYFALGEDQLRPADQWFGGGADMTPYYPDLSDVQHFHGTWKDVCDRHPIADYDAFKQQCDEYFFLPHRDESRGVGGIFFDYVRDDPESAFAFVRDAGDAFLASYVPLVERHADDPYGERERIFQTVRRGRYAEFNLLYDRGTKFGIETRGRAESILMSLPPEVRWKYDWRPEPGTDEARALWFMKPRDWLMLRVQDVPAPESVEREASSGRYREPGRGV